MSDGQPHLAIGEWVASKALRRNVRPGMTTIVARWMGLHRADLIGEVWVRSDRTPSLT